MSAIVNKIEGILEHAYSTQNYIELMQEIFSSMKLAAPNNFHKEFTNFSSHIEGYIHIADYISPENKKIAIFAVQLKKGFYVENSRSTQRSYAKKLIESGNCDAAIVAFFTPDDGKWRLSFVRLDYEMKIEHGKLKTKENITPAKRYSFLVGEGEPCHTAKDRFRQFVLDNNSNPTLDELEEAFSVEKVTKEFFELYCEKFYQLQEYLDANEDFVAESERCGFTSEQFAKKLMGQIVFLYFLQKKGWLGVNVWPSVLTEKEYKNVFYAVGGTEGKIIKETLPQIYVLQQDGNYRLNTKALDEISDSDEEVVANHMVRNKTWGDGSKSFLPTIFKFSKNHKGHFFENYLEPLFYETLNKNRGKFGYCPTLHCRIPFLSGGLFEPLDGYNWKISNFDIPDEIFSNKQDANDRNADGILDIFDRYNFTMSEDEPMEREVAIDPEMLGKIFENLLEVKDRKSKGAFYTPREIVHYMCQESLINYLVRKTGISEDAIRDLILYGDFMKDEDTEKTLSVRDDSGKIHMEFDFQKDMYISEEILSFKNGVNRLLEIDEALANVKVADPAVGSGAFPLGMLNEIVRARTNITEYLGINMNKRDKWFLYKNERSPYFLKKHAIKNSIFAVDIEPSAVDISQLRLWLSLVIDDEITPNAQNELEGHRDPIPLPNLESNIICGNSLIDEYEGIKLVDESDILHNTQKYSQAAFGQSEFETILNKLLQAQDELFSCEEPNKKIQLKENIQSYKDMIALNQFAFSGALEETKERYKVASRMASKPYVAWQLDFARVFRDNGGFDIVIGNPPYVGEEGNKEIFQEIAKTEFGKKYYIGKMDLWYFFTSKGLQLIKPNGTLSFIAPNNWMTTAGGKNMRKHIASESKILSFVTFNNVMVFESASQQTMIFLLEKKQEKEPYLLRYKAVGNMQLNQNELTQFLRGKDIGDNYVSSYNPDKNSDGRTIQFLNSMITEITEKIAHGEKMYLENDEILNGIHPHHAEVTKKMLPILPNSNVGDGIFILKNEEVTSLELSEKEKELLHPYYDSNNIGRYYFNPRATKQIIYTTSEFKDISLMDSYPIIKNHLDKYVDVITSDNRPYGLHRARKQEFFENPAIVSLRKCSIPQFSYIETPAYVTAEWYVIMTNRVDLRYLTALLNSKIIKFWLLKMGKMQGSIYQVDKEPLVNIPILKPNNELEIEIVELYDKVIEIKSDNRNADSSEFEDTIDALLYDAYQLNDVDISTIEKTIYDWENNK